MKFIIQIPQLIYGGAEKALVSFANCLVRRGHQVEILETYEKGLLREQCDPRVTFYAICSNAYTGRYYASLDQVRAEHRPLQKLQKLGRLCFSKLVGYRRFAQYLAARHYRGLHFDAAVNYLEIESPAFVLDCISADRKFQWVHSDVSAGSVRERLAASPAQLKRMDHIFCVSEYAAEQFRRMYPQLRDKTTFLCNFFEAERVRQLGQTPFAYPAGGPVLLSVGRMTPAKNYLRFLDVLSRVQKQGIAFQWYVLGMGYQQQAICRKAEALGLQRQVHLLGVTENPYPYMAGCDLFVLPSSWEGFPTVTVEARLLGCPVLATDVSGIREQLIHGETGWIVENSAEGLYQGLVQLLTHPELMQSLRQADGLAPLLDEEHKYRQWMQALGA